MALCASALATTRESVQRCIAEAVTGKPYCPVHLAYMEGRTRDVRPSPERDADAAVLPWSEQDAAIFTAQACTRKPRTPRSLAERLARWQGRG